jgi:hypothetical protein
MAFAQAIVRNPAGKMMDVVEPDIPGHPVQRRRQIVERGALQRRRAKVPVPLGLPVRLLELVLNVEEPNANGCGQQNDRQPPQQHR